MKPVLYQQQHIETLKSSVLNAADIDVILPGDCYSLSLKIAEGTGKRVSETTLKRIFGFTTQYTRPSRYTLNVLSEYAGFEDWSAFCRHTDQDIVFSGEDPSWAEVRSIATKISLHQVQGNRYQSGIPYDYTVARRGLDNYLAQFIASESTVCMVDGDTGAGKTIAITHWVERQINESLRDVVLFTNSHAILQHLMLGYDGNRWLANLLELVSPDLIDRFMSDHAQNAPGKFFLVIDEARFRFERQPPNHSVFAEMVNMVSHFSKYPWFRFILVMRSTTFDLYHRYYENLLAKPEWFLGENATLERERVVQKFTAVELRQLLNRIHGNPASSSEDLPPELEPLRLPRLFQYYYEMTDGHPLPFKNSRTVLFGVFHRYITRLINAISMGMDTQLLLEKLVQLVKQEDDEGYYISKREAIMLINSNRTCYQALLNSGLVEEIIKQKNVLERSLLRFQSEMVLSYFIALSRFEQETKPVAELNGRQDIVEELTRQWFVYFSPQNHSIA